MNKNRFRIIFNQLRGLSMAVAEHVRSHAAQTSTTSGVNISIDENHNAVATKMRLLAFSVMLMLGVIIVLPNQINIGQARADIHADPTAPKNQQPIVLSAPNGVEVVNIRTPNAAGISRNTYSQFDVPRQGAIINNSRTNVQSQLGGWLQGNPFLAAGAARVIFNEVNSNNPSYLNGYIEIAGSRAQFILANPNGITCKGCGFINAYRATLTTGIPIFNDGDLAGYRVHGGDINIIGDGLDAGNTNYTDIIARAINVNAGIWADNLAITTGTNEVNATNTQVTAISPVGAAPASGFALDVAALGGMYAKKIAMIGTESGLGVRNAGTIGASAGNITLSADGQLQNSGSMIAQADVTIQTAGSINNTGTLYAQANTSLGTQADIDNSGLIAAQGNNTLTANGASSQISNTSNAVLAAGLQADGTLIAANATTGHLNLNATQAIAAAGKNLSAGDQSLTAKQLDISGSDTFANHLTLVASNGDIHAQNATISANQTLTASTLQTLYTDGAAISASQLNLTVHDLSNIGGELLQTGAGDTSINLAGNLDNTQGRIATNSNNLTLSAQTIINTDAGIEHAGAGQLTIRSTAFEGHAGQIISNGALDLTAPTVNLDQGSTVARQVSIDTATLNNQSGEIIQTGTGNTSIKAGTMLDSSFGLIASNGNTTLTVGRLNNQAGSIQAAETSNLTINAAGSIDNSMLNGVAASIQAGGTLSVSADSVNNAHSEITAGNALDIITASNSLGLQNAQGLIAANQAVTLNTASLDNSSGTIASVHDSVAITARTGSIDNSAGQVTAEKVLSASSIGLNNATGLLSAGSAVINSQLQALDNTGGSIMTDAALELQTGTLTNDGGLIQSGADLTINTHGQALTNTHSGTSKGILALGSSTFTTGSLNNQTGYIGTQGDITANSTAINNNNGTITGEAAITLKGSSLDNQSGRVEALANVDISAANSIDNRAGLLRSGQTLNLTADALDNRNTQNAGNGIEGAAVNINANVIDNTGGSMLADNSLRVKAADTFNNAQGKVSSAATLHIQDKLADTVSNVGTKTLAVTNIGGSIIAGTDLVIDSRSLTGDGKVLSQGDLSTKLTTDYTHSGEWQADGNATFITTGNLTNQAKLLAGGNLDIAAANIDNKASGEIAGANLNVTVTDKLTNRGLLDGRDTFIKTATLDNIGTGRIYGDHVAIAATTLNNIEETLNGNTTAAVIAARDRLDIGAANITNREHALLFSTGDMAIGGALDMNHQATVAAGQPQAAVLNNNSATIETLGNLALNIDTINNTNQHFSTTNEIVSESKTPARAVNMAGPTLSPAPDTGNTRKFQAANAAYTPIGKIYNYDEVHFSTPNFTYIYANDGSLFASYFWQFNEGTIVHETRVNSTDPGQILAGGSAKVTATNLLNDNSKIIAGGTLNGSVTNLDNRETLGQRSSQYTSQSSLIYPRESKPYSRVLIYAPGDTAPVIETINLGTATYLGNTAFSGTGTKVAALNTGSVSQNATGAGNANVAVVAKSGQGVNTQVAPVITNTQTGAGTVVRTVSPNTTLPNSSLFHPNSNPTGNYLIETDPRFANYRNWLSSDYILKALSYDPATITKRLGDGFYEQRLIREQINQLTGKRFLTGYNSDETEYQALMANGVTFAQTYQLIPGVALTEAQIAQLTSDIVWLVEKTVTLPDGTTVQALVPQVYVKLQAGDIDGAGSLLAGNSINLNLTGDLTNSGTIAGRSIVAINADNINNLQGRISANTTSLNARTDINNLGGQITGHDSLSLNAGHDINIASTTKSNRMVYDATAGKNTIHVDVSRTNIDRVAGLYVDNPNGILVASSGNNLNLQGAVISNSGDNGLTVLNANNDIKLGTIATSSNNSYVRDARNYQKNNSTEQVGSSIQTQGNLTLNAGNNLSARAANVSIESGNLTANAQNNLTIEAGIDTSHSESASYSKKKGTFSSKTKTTRDTYNSTDVVSSTFSGEQVNLNANNDLTIIGSNVVATQDVNLNAGNNITLTAEQATHDETHYSKTKKSGFSSSGSSVGYGSSKLTTTNDTQTVTNVGSTIGSVKGDVNINVPVKGIPTNVDQQAGNIGATGKVTITGSDVLTPQGDINITAQKVDINAATDTYANQQTMKYKQSGITIGVSNPVISAAQTVNQLNQAAKDTSDPRMQALAAGTSVLAVSNAYNAVQAGQGGNAADQAGGISLSISIGTSTSKSSSSQTVNTAKGSTLNAGGDINITAVGDGKNSDINVTGSQIKAAHDVTLNAQDEINLSAAQNTSKLDSKNKSSSASLGVSVSLGAAGGVGITAGVSSAKGKANGRDTSWTETQIQGGNQQGDQVNLNSGTDTNLIGAQVSGNQVIANVGTTGEGNLNIQSLQDTSNYQSKQKSSGISVTVPVTGTGYGGSISTSKTSIKSDYASVNEQSGIFAGDEGFQVNTQGNTNLKGAVIASTDKAIQDNKNSLNTQTLTTSNIQNSAEYEAKGYSVAAGVGFNKQPDGSGLKNTPTASAGSSHLSDGSSSVTVSGISGGTVNITDPTQQQTKTGKDATTTVATLNRDVQTQITTGKDAQGNATTTVAAVDSKGNKLANTLKPIFDKEQVQRELNAQIQITQAFSQVAPKAVGDYASNKVKELTAQGNAEEAKKWDEGGIYRIALHTALGGLLTGDLSGAAGAGLVAGSADLLNQLQSKVSESLQAAGLGKEGASTISQALAELTSLGIGSAIGGTAGAGTALVVDTNNRQLHESEKALAKKWAKTLQQKLANKENPEIISEQEAVARIERQILRWVDADTNRYDGGKTDYDVVALIGVKGKDGNLSWDYNNYALTHANEYNTSSKNAYLYEPKLFNNSNGLTAEEFRNQNLGGERAGKASMLATGCLGLGPLCSPAAIGLGLSIGFDYLMDDKISNADVIVSPIGGVFGYHYLRSLNNLAGGEAAKWSAQTLAIEGVELGTTWGLEQLPTYSLGRTEFGGPSFDPLLDRATNPYWGWGNIELFFKPTVTPEVKK